MSTKKHSDEATVNTTPTCLLSEEVCIPAVMTDVTMKHVVGHEGETGSGKEEKSR